VGNLLSAPRLRSPRHRSHLPRRPVFTRLVRVITDAERRRSGDGFARPRLLPVSRGAALLGERIPDIATELLLAEGDGAAREFPNVPLIIASRTRRRSSAPS
jgi:hypothetical protein